MSQNLPSAPKVTAGAQFVRSVGMPMSFLMIGILIGRFAMGGKK